MTGRLAVLALAPLALTAAASAAEWPAPKAPVVPAADGYVAIPNAAVPPSPAHTYRAIWDATKGAADPKQLIPALNNAGSELNAFGVAGVSPSHVQFAVVFHGDVLNALLDDAHYKAKFGVPNPNLPVLDQFKKAGVELFVCGQNLAAERIDPKVLTPAVTVASDALIVLMDYQNRGYALLSFQAAHPRRIARGLASGRPQRKARA